MNPAAGKNDGDEYQDLTSKKYKATKDADDGGHHGAVTGTHRRVLRPRVGSKSAAATGFFSSDRGRIKLSRAADLARDGEHAAIARL